MHWPGYNNTIQRAKPATIACDHYNFNFNFPSFFFLCMQLWSMPGRNVLQSSVSNLYRHALVIYKAASGQFNKQHRRNSGRAMRKTGHGAENAGEGTRWYMKPWESAQATLRLPHPRDMCYPSRGCSWTCREGCRR